MQRVSSQVLSAPTLCAIALGLALCSVPSRAVAQVADTARPAPPQVRTAVRRAALDSVPRPPISTRRAFITSLLAPGLGQSQLGRNNAAAVFVLVESISLVMLRESAAQVRVARRSVADTVVVAYTADAQGRPVPVRETGQYTARRLAARKGHLEDWIALLIANHLFSGADAFVAANLWDVRAQVGLQRAAPGLGVGVTLRRVH